MGKFNNPKGSQTFVATEKASDAMTLVTEINAVLVGVYANYTLFTSSFYYDSNAGEHVCFLTFIV